MCEENRYRTIDTRICQPSWSLNLWTALVQGTLEFCNKLINLCRLQHRENDIGLILKLEAWCCVAKISRYFIPRHAFRLQISSRTAPVLAGPELRCNVYCFKHYTLPTRYLSDGLRMTHTSFAEKRPDNSFWGFPRNTARSSLKIQTHLAAI